MKNKENGMIRLLSMPGNRKNDLLAACLLVIFAFWINRGIEIKGLYMDDLYLWSCYGEQSFLEYVFPMGSTRFRFLYYLAAWLELAVIGNHIGWIVPINILLNVGIAYTLYKIACGHSRSVYVGILCGIGFLASRMSYYQISQLYGLMESLALWMAIGILHFLYQYLHHKPGENDNRYLAACVLYFAVCFVHERYMVLLPLFYLVLVCRKERQWKVWAVPAAAFGLVQLVRLVTIGGLMPAGTGRTQVSETFSLGTAARYAISQIAYLFGVNAGPQYLNGEHFLQSPSWVKVLVMVADLMLLLVVLAFFTKWIRDWRTMKEHRRIHDYLHTGLLFVGFIAGCIACSSVTIRVEMRWVYVSYGAALLFLSWIYGVLTDGMVEKGRWMQALPYLFMLTVYVGLMLPVELHYRSCYPNLYFWENQQRYNSLAEETYETYGDDLFGKTIYIVGNQYEMSDFTAETFFKVFDRQRKAEGTRVVHIEDVRDIGLVTDQMLVLQEDPAHDRFLDITAGVKKLKCRGLYGYYEDGWIDEKAKVQVMAGTSGKIDMSFYYPGTVGADQWITVCVNEGQELYLQITEAMTEISVEAKPFETVELMFETNFYYPEASEQRGERKMAVVLGLKAD